mmetsp:Transcript_33322/g.106338  ORF Transcript_33322/g.106338 Transcript_33322/m.106338 type:complete len:215 (-) Transcript_33322:218-862(-)
MGWTPPVPGTAACSPSRPGPRPAPSPARRPSPTSRPFPEGRGTCRWRSPCGWQAAVMAPWARGPAKGPSASRCRQRTPCDLSATCSSSPPTARDSFPRSPAPPPSAPTSSPAAPAPVRRVPGAAALRTGATTAGTSTPPSMGGAASLGAAHGQTPARAYLPTTTTAATLTGSPTPGASSTPPRILRTRPTGRPATSRGALRNYATRAPMASMTT